MPRARMQAIASLELRTQLRGAPFWTLLLIVVAATSTLNPVAMIRGGGETVDGVRAFANSVHALAPTFAMSAFFVYPFFVALMAGLTVLRDDEVGMTDLIGSSPVSTREYLVAKLAGVVAALLLALGVHLLVVMAFRELGVGGVARGPFSLASYVVPLVVLALPGVLWMAGLAFSLGAATRRPMLVYALPTALYVAQFALFWNWHPVGIAPWLDHTLMVLDPTGLRWLSHSLFAEDRGLGFYNTAPLALDATIVAGRLLTLMVPAAAVWALGVRRARRTDAPPSGAATAVTARPTRATFAPLGELWMQSRAPGWFTGLRTVLTAELRELRAQPAGYLFGLALLAIVMEVGGGEVDDYGLPLLTSAGDFAVRTIPVVTVLVCLYLLFTVVEMMHRDRATGFESLALSSPIPTTAMLSGRGIAALTLVVVLLAVCVVGGIGAAVLQPGARIEAGPLLLVFGLVLAPTFILWTSFVMAVMVVVRQRTSALAIGLATLVLTAAHFMGGGMTWLSNWPLWGALRWTDFGPFPLNGPPLLLNRLLALGSAALCFAVASRAFARTERDVSRGKERRRPVHVLRAGWRLAPLAVVPAVAAGLLAVRIDRAAPARGASVASAASEGLPATGAREGAPFGTRLAHIDLTIELKPQARTMDARGTYDVENRGASTLQALRFHVPAVLGEVIWEGGAERSTGRRVRDTVEVALTAPLRPGDRVRVGFRYRATMPARYTRNGGGASSYILPEATVLSTHRGAFLPALVGAERDARGFTSRMTVSAPRQYTVNGVGDLVAEKTVGNRSTVTWATEHPVVALSLMAGRWNVARAPGAAVFHLAAHASRAPNVLHALRAARTRYAEWYAPYPWQELRLAESPDLETQATAYPTTIAVSEGLGWRTPEGVRGGLAFAVAAHEAAHQWWGHLLNIAEGPGTGMLAEGLADYSALLLIDAELGPQARMAFARALEAQYLAGRSTSRERPILETSEDGTADESVLQKRGAWAMWMLHQHLGERRTFAALQQLIARHQRLGTAATPASLLESLRAVAPDPVALELEVAQWLGSTALPELAIDRSQCQRQGTAWRCDADIRNAGTGTISVDVDARRNGEAIADGRQRVMLGAGRTARAQWTLSSRPDELVIDPEVRVLQRHRERARATISER